MLEDTNQDQTLGSPQQTPAVLEPTVMPTEPRDMFADVDGAAHGVPTTMQEPNAEASTGGYTFEEEEEPRPWYVQKKFIALLLGIVLVLIIAIFGVQFALRFFVPQPLVPTPTPSPAPTISAPATETPAPEPVPQTAPPAPTTTTQPNTPQEQSTVQEVDTDGDGLLDDEEQAIDTSTTLPDTDGDELSDREEFRVFGTNPLNPDTDGDTYLDGVEVRSGYNPKGEGKLFTIPSE